MNGASSVSERIRAEARGAWNAILGHRFFREVATDSIDDHVFARYLRIETKGNAEQQSTRRTQTRARVTQAAA